MKKYLKAMCFAVTAVAAINFQSMVLANNDPDAEITNPAGGESSTTVYTAVGEDYRIDGTVKPYDAGVSWSATTVSGTGTGSCSGGGATYNTYDADVWTNFSSNDPGEYTVDLTATNTDGLSATDTSGYVTVVGVEDIEHMHEDAFNYATGSNVSIETGKSMFLKPIKDPSSANWPSSTPEWEIVSKPSGSTLTAPSDGTAIANLTFDKKGIYEIKVTCGTSNETITVEAKDLAINVTAIDDDSTRTALQSDLLESTVYYVKAVLNGGTSYNWGTVTWTAKRADGSLTTVNDSGWMSTTDWTTSMWTGEVPNNAWNFSSYIMAEVDDGEGNTDSDKKDTVVHREYEVDTNAVAWDDVGLTGAWQIFETVQSGGSVSRTDNVSLQHSVSYSLTVGSTIGAEAEGVMKAELSISETFGVSFTKTVGHSQTVTTAIPAEPAGKYWGVFSNGLREQKDCPVTKWYADGSSVDAGTADVERQRELCLHSQEPGDSVSDAQDNYPVY